MREKKVLPRVKKPGSPLNNNNIKKKKHIRNSFQLLLSVTLGLNHKSNRKQELRHSNNNITYFIHPSELLLDKILF